MKTLHLKRVAYSKNSTPKEEREYQLAGEFLGAVGTLKEWEELYPGTKLEIVEDGN